MDSPSRGWRGQQQPMMGGAPKATKARRSIDDEQQEGVAQRSFPKKKGKRGRKKIASMLKF